MSLIESLPCYLNGEFSTLDKCSISVMDRGFIFGDGIYEVVPVYAGRPFRLASHFSRLARSLREVRIENPLTDTQWRAVVEELVSLHSKMTDKPAATLNQLIYIQVTRGVAMRDHVMPEGIAPTVFAMVNPLKDIPDSHVTAGVRCITAEDFRWGKAHIKSTSLLGAVLSRQMSADVGALETIMFRNGNLSEAAASNVWVVKDGKVSGPPKDNLVLEGIRYAIIEELCQAEGIPFSLEEIDRSAVFSADELMISSATKGILPVIELDTHVVGTGKPGPIFQRLLARYQLEKLK